MKTTSRASVGLVLGLTVAFLLIITTIALSAMTSATTAIPMVFSATVGEENGLPSIEFVPNGFGLAVIVIVVAVAYTLAGRSRRRSR